jgi:hypothetical protein
MNFKVDNLCKRKWGWEFYIYFDDTPPIEARLSQEKEPTKAQIDSIIAYHTERLTFIKSQPVIAPLDSLLVKLQEAFPELASKITLDEGIKAIKDNIAELKAAKDPKVGK